jgi:hypothetical protein
MTLNSHHFALFGLALLVRRGAEPQKVPWEGVHRISLQMARQVSLRFDG